MTLLPALPSASWVQSTNCYLTLCFKCPVTKLAVQLTEQTRPCRFIKYTGWDYVTEDEQRIGDKTLEHPTTYDAVCNAELPQPEATVPNTRAPSGIAAPLSITWKSSVPGSELLGVTCSQNWPVVISRRTSVPACPCNEHNPTLLPYPVGTPVTYVSSDGWDMQHKKRALFIFRLENVFGRDDTRYLHARGTVTLAFLSETKLAKWIRSAWTRAWIWALWSPQLI
jgi:hypothetical protein